MGPVASREEGVTANIQAKTFQEARHSGAWRPRGTVRSELAGSVPPRSPVLADLRGQQQGWRLSVLARSEVRDHQEPLSVWHSPQNHGRGTAVTPRAGPMASGPAALVPLSCSPNAPAAVISRGFSPAGSLWGRALYPDLMLAILGNVLKGYK